MADSNDKLEVFEVFRVAALSRHELQNLPEAELRRRFSLLQPVTSAEQLASCEMIATLPKDGHMVVSRTKLHEMMSERLSLALRDHMQKIRARADEALFRAHEVRCCSNPIQPAIQSMRVCVCESNQHGTCMQVFESDRIEISTLLQSVVETQHSKLDAVVKDANDKKQRGETLDAEALLASVTELLEQQRKQLDILFTNPYFRAEQLAPAPTLAIDDDADARAAAQDTVAATTSSSTTPTPTAATTTSTAADE